MRSEPLPYSTDTLPAHGIVVHTYGMAGESIITVDRPTSARTCTSSTATADSIWSAIRSTPWACTPAAPPPHAPSRRSTAPRGEFSRSNRSPRRLPHLVIGTRNEKGSEAKVPIDSCVVLRRSFRHRAVISPAIMVSSRPTTIFARPLRRLPIPSSPTPPCAIGSTGRPAQARGVLDIVQEGACRDGADAIYAPKGGRALLVCDRSEVERCTGGATAGCAPASPVAVAIISRGTPRCRGRSRP